MVSFRLGWHTNTRYAALNGFTNENFFEPTRLNLNKGLILIPPSPVDVLKRTPFHPPFSLAKSYGNGGKEYEKHAEFPQNSLFALVNLHISRGAISAGPLAITFGLSGTASLARGA